MWEKLKYKLRNFPALFRSAKVLVGAKVSETMGFVSMVGTLEAKLHRFYSYIPGVGLHFGPGRWQDGKFIPDFNAWDPAIIDYGFLSARVVTDTGVAFLVDDWDANGQDISTMNFHGCGTGTNAEAVGDTALQTESTTILNPDSTRATGTRSQPAANQFRSVGTATFDGSGAITEHGILSQAATGGGVLWDRSVFSAINVANGDSIQFTYTCTVNSGG
jgi:hypothetical protein